MRSRKAQALSAAVIFFAIAKLFDALTPHSVENWRALFWSLAGIGVYIALSHAFGFDPHRTKLSASASALKQYVDRWELRLGQATLAMLGLIVVAARAVDPDHFVTAVVCGTLSAWTYFALRLYSNGYQTPAMRTR